MDDEKLRVGVVRLRLANDQEMSVRASDIVSVIAPRDPYPAQRTLTAPAVIAAGELRAIDGVIAAEQPVAGYALTLNVTGTGGYSHGTPRPIVRIRHAPDTVVVMNSREELEQWMRDS